MNMQSLTGIEQLQALINGKLPPPTMGITMNIELVSAKSGDIRFEGFANDTHLNPMGGVHGGFAATLLDSATGCAVHSILNAGESYGTIDLNVKMMRPIPQKVKLICQGKILNRSKTLAVSEGTIVDDDGKLYAHATCTCKIINPQG